jgi:hypothetical protein
MISQRVRGCPCFIEIICGLRAGISCKHNSDHTIAADQDRIGASFFSGSECAGYIRLCD